MKKYASVLRIKFIGGLQYRAAAFGGVATQFAWGFMYILLFRAFYAAGAADFPMMLDQLTSYLWLQQALLTLFSSWVWEMDIFNAISEGSIAYELVRPMDLYSRWYAQTVGMRLARVALRCLPILLVAAFLPEGFRLYPPAGLAAFGLFLGSSVLALGVVVAYSMLICALAFRTLNAIGLRTISTALGEFLAGALIPLPFFPAGVRQVVQLLPFASMQNTPLRLYIGDMTGTEAAFSMALQLFWLVALVALGRLLMKRSLAKVVVQGG